MANRGSTSVVVNGLEVQKHFLPQTSFTQSKHFYCYCRLCIILTFTLTLRWMHREQLELQYLAKGFFGMQIRGARDDLLYLLNHNQRKCPAHFEYWDLFVFPSWLLAVAGILLLKSELWRSTDQSVTPWQPPLAKNPVFPSWLAKTSSKKMEAYLQSCTFSNMLALPGNH